MKFSDKLIVLRKEKKLTQTQLAKILGISLRSIQNYEKGTSYPKQTLLYSKMAKLFGVSTNYLLTSDDFAFDYGEPLYRNDPEKAVHALIADIGGMFAGGDLSDDDKDKVMMAINNLYWKAKEKARKNNSKNNKFDIEE